jgi:hypothetical protein
MLPGMSGEGWSVLHSIEHEFLHDGSEGLHRATGKHRDGGAQSYDWPHLARNG